jgi:threonylcarbamoyladenosine tRNA methylthiotransferase MtaB
MKRRHSRDDALAIVGKLRSLRPDMVFGADIIAGFPTETDAMFANTLAIVAEADLTYLHVFPYSPREGTPAARMPQVDKKIARNRAEILRQAGNLQLANLMASRIGKIENVLIERNGLGRTEQFVPVTVAGSQPGELLAVRVTGTAADGLIGEALREAA